MYRYVWGSGYSSSTSKIDSCAVESLPEGFERERRGLRDNAVAGEVELVGVRVKIHPFGSPIIHSTNRGLRSIAPLPVLAPLDDAPLSIPRTATSVNVAPATSVNVAPACRPDSRVQFPATPLALQSVAVGVGS
jgi:hypothetical protein